MKRTWKVTRQARPLTDGEARWQQAYQLLLMWSQNEPPSTEKEANDERRGLRQGVHTAPGATTEP